MFTVASLASGFATSAGVLIASRAAQGLSAAARDFAAVMAQADTTALGAMQGRTDTQALVQSIAEAQMALETAVAIRDKVVEAYQDILRMPV